MKSITFRENNKLPGPVELVDGFDQHLCCAAAAETETGSATQPSVSRRMNQTQALLATIHEHEDEFITVTLLLPSLQLQDHTDK